MQYLLKSQCLLVQFLGLFLLCRAEASSQVVHFLWVVRHFSNFTLVAEVGVSEEI